jgi:hypothetical protein
MLLKISDPELTIARRARQRGGARYSEAALRLILSIQADRRDVLILIVEE